MSIRAEVTLECDGCGESVIEDMNPDQDADEIIDSIGWFKVGTLLDRLLCEDCYEKEGES